jgi:protein-arginine kinase activator protein McsA
MRILYTALLPLCLILANCSDFKKDKSETMTLAPEESFDVELVGLPSPNQFQAKLKFSNIEIMKKEMQKAIIEERYEEAAILRDKIKASH